MKIFRIAALSLLFVLGGCANFQNAWNVLTSAQVTPQTVVVAANTFDALEATATAYLKLRRCSATSGPVCRDPGVTKKIIPAVRSGRVARNNLEQFFRDHPGQLGPQGLYDALQAAINTLQGIISQYHLAMNQPADAHLAFLDEDDGLDDALQFSTGVILAQ